MVISISASLVPFMITSGTKDVNMSAYRDQIIDIGGSRLQSTLRRKLEDNLLQPNYRNQYLLPSPLLSDDTGSKIWKEINAMPHYYQTDHEIDLLNKHGAVIAQLIEPDTAIIDLGCGDVRKVRPLLDHIENAGKEVHYFGLDLSLTELEASIGALSGLYTNIHVTGLWGTFDDGRIWADSIRSPRWFLSLGSSLGNDFTEPAIAHLALWRAILRPADRILLGQDANHDWDMVWASYHDKSAVFERFMRNGLAHTNQVLGYEWYKHVDWEVFGSLSQTYPMHQFNFQANKEIVCEPLGVRFPQGHLIVCYEGFKWAPKDMAVQFSSAGLVQLGLWKSPTSAIYEYLLAAAEDTY